MNREQTAGEHVMEHADPRHCEVCAFMWLGIYAGSKDNYNKFCTTYNAYRISTINGWNRLLTKYNKTPQKMLEEIRNNE